MVERGCVDRGGEDRGLLLVDAKIRKGIPRVPWLGTNRRHLREDKWLEFDEFVVLRVRAGLATGSSAALIIENECDHLEGFHIEHPSTKVLHVNTIAAKGQVMQLFSNKMLGIESMEEFGYFGRLAESVIAYEHVEVMRIEEEGVDVEVEIRMEQRDEGWVHRIDKVKSQALELEYMLGGV